LPTVTIEGVTITYSLAVGVALAKATVSDHGLGTWLGDMGNAFHQWINGDPAQGRRHGDHTAWSEDGPPGVVKAFDWTPDSMARFEPWLLTQLRAGQYRESCKFVNLNGRQWSGTGIYQKTSDDHHLHWSYLPDAVDAAVNPLDDYYREIVQEDDMDPKTPVPLPGNLPAYLGTYTPSAAYLWHGTYMYITRVDAALRAFIAAEQVRDAATDQLLREGAGSPETAAILATVRQEAAAVRDAVLAQADEHLRDMAAALAAAADPV